jgi:hypothetical protein
MKTSGPVKKYRAAGIMAVAFFALLFLLSGCDFRDWNNPYDTEGDWNGDAPSDLTISFGVGGVHLSWHDNSDLEDGYRIDRKVNNDPWEEEYALLPADVSSWDDSEVAAGWTVTYRVAALFDENISDFVQEQISLHVLLPAPANLTARTSPNLNSVVLNWQDNSSDETGFLIDRKQDNLAWDLTYGQVGANTTTWVDNQVDYTANYTYRVRAVRGAVFSDASNVAARGFWENEPACSDDYDDYTNGGCNSDPAVFGEIACWQTVLGTSGTYTYGEESFRDTDWFGLTLTESADISFIGRAEFPLLIYFFDISNCDDFGNVVFDYETAAPGQNATLDLDNVPPGTYIAFVSPQDFEGVQCGAGYGALLICTSGNAAQEPPKHPQVDPARVAAH